MTPELETPRLTLKPLQVADAEQVQKLFSQWEVVRYLNAVVPWPYPADGALTYIRDHALPAIARGELWCWTIRLKSAPGQIIGAITLSIKDEENRGFWLAPEWQRQGLMTEACHAATDYWFEVLGRPVLRAPKAIANEASRRISVKQGMRIVSREERDYVCGRMPSETWEITAEQWRARKPGNLRPLPQQQNARNS
jgi:RimJ/RimL family protein N-acetyltransferase